MDKMELVYLVCKRLLKHYGPQHWWPITTKDKIHKEFEIILGAILTQNTAWSNVEKSLRELEKNNLIGVERIRGIEEKKLAELIRSSGYYNQKAKKLKAVANFLKENKINQLEKLETGILRKKLLDVHGIGNETADSILLYALNKPVFVVDAYTKRIFSRIGLKCEDSSYEEVQNFFHSRLKRDTKMFNEYHALIVEHGKRICKKKPLCDECVLKIMCKRVF